MSTLIIQPSQQDALLGEVVPDTNFGSDIYLYLSQDFDYSEIGEGPYVDDYTAIQFDISSLPVGAVISSAIMELYQIKSYGSSHDISWLRNTSWSEETVTWNSKPTTGDIVVSATKAATEGWHSYDITTAVQNWFSGAWSNYGLTGVKSNGNETDYLEYRSKEYGTASLRPKLTITYTIPVAFTPNFIAIV